MVGISPTCGVEGDDDVGVLAALKSPACLDMAAAMWYGGGMGRFCLGCRLDTLWPDPPTSLVATSALTGGA